MELQSLAVAISDRLPGPHRITVERIDPVTGNAAHIVSEGAPVTADGNFLRDALDHVRTVGPAMGITDRPQDFVADSVVRVATTGARAVQLRQRYKGIPVFQAVTMVRFTSNSTLQDVTGRTVAVIRDVGSVPVTPVQRAVLAAARCVAGANPCTGGPFDSPSSPGPGIDLTGFDPTIRVVFTSTPEHTTVLEPGPFGAEINASLVWFWSNDQLALGWNVVFSACQLPSGVGFTMPQPAQYHIVIDDLSGKLLYCRHQPAPTMSPASSRFPLPHRPLELLS